MRSVANKASKAKKATKVFMTPYWPSWLFLPFWLISCSSPQRIQPAADVRQEAAPAVIQIFTLVETVMGKKAVEITAKTAFLDPTRRMIHGEPISMVSFDKNGNTVSRLTANEGWLETETNNMKAKGAVKVHSSSGSVLETEELEWNQQTGTIRTELPVKVIQKDNVLTGVGLISDPGLDSVTIRQVDAVVTDPEAFREEQREIEKSK